MIVAVDGPSGAGKSTVCRECARRLGWRLLDTGAIYRCVALEALQQGVEHDPKACAAIAKTLDIRFVASSNGQRVFIGNRDVSGAIRSYETTKCVNSIAPMPEVRRELLAVQRRLGRADHAIVEGRDIGSVVFPDAQLKVYYTASPEARAKRRMREFETKGEKVCFADIVQQIKERDHTEFTRKESPLIQCADAIILDTSTMDFDHSVQALLTLIESKYKEIENK